MTVDVCAPNPSSRVVLQLNKLVARNANEEQKLKASVLGKKQVSLASPSECKPMISQMMQANTVSAEIREPLIRRGVRRQNVCV